MWRCLRSKAHAEHVEAAKEIGRAGLAAMRGLRVLLVVEIDGVVHAAALAVLNARSRDADSEMGFTGSGAADQHHIALLLPVAAFAQAPPILARAGSKHRRAGQ